MTPFESFSGQSEPSPEHDAWATIDRILVRLQAAGESMGENQPFYDEELRRIIARLEIFRHEPGAAILLHGTEQQNAHVFVPANQQAEGLLAIESDEAAKLKWRVLINLENDSKVFWECSLVESERDRTFVVLYQTLLSDEQATPELINSYLRHEVEHPGDTSPYVVPQYMALVDADRGASISSYYDGEDLSHFIMPVSELGRLFYQPE